jgi:hypothetical protein
MRFFKPVIALMLTARAMAAPAPDTQTLPGLPNSIADFERLFDPFGLFKLTTIEQLNKFTIPGFPIGGLTPGATCDPTSTHCSNPKTSSLSETKAD